MEPSWIFAVEEASIPENGMAAVFPKGLQFLIIRSGEFIDAKDFG